MDRRNITASLLRQTKLRRREFLQGAGGLIAVSILGLPATADTPSPVTSDAGAIPGTASRRIEGRAKVTGRKIYARDFNARDLPDWPSQQSYALYLCALTTDHAFLGVDLSSLSSGAQPTRVVLGNHLSEAQRTPTLNRTRDLNVQTMAREQASAAVAEMLAGARGGLDAVLEYDLVVVPGKVPDFLGQAVALLIFDTLAAYRAARREMQFRDADFQIYGLDTARNSTADTPYAPQTTYVKFTDPGGVFSYATADPGSYAQQAPQYRQKIAAYLAQHPDYLEQEFAVDTQAMDPMFMEPESGLVHYDPVTRRLRVLVGTQSPDGDVADMVSMYGAHDSPIEVKEIELTSCWPGGGFGGRDSSPFSLLLALTAAFAGGKPVKLAYDRFDQFRLGLKRPGARIRGRLVVAPDKKIQLVDARLDFNGGGLKNLSPYVANLASLCIGGSYEVPYADIFAQSIHTRDIPGGSQRGFGGPEAYLAIETAIDDIAAKNGWDPIEFRRANIATDTTRTVVGGPIGQELRLGEMLDIAAAHPLWKNRAAIKGDYHARGLVYGTGLAMSLQAYGTSGDGMVAAVMLEPDGAISIRSDAVDMGNGSATTLAVVVGPILGANAARIAMGDRTLFAETGLTTKDPTNQRWLNPKWTPKGVGSSSACLTGLHQVHTVQQTAKALVLGSILPAARKLWGMPNLSADDLVWKNGSLAESSGKATPIPRQALAQAVHSGGLPHGAIGHAYFQASWAEADFATEAGDARLALDGLSFYQAGASSPKMVERKNTTGPDAASKRYSRYVWAPCVNVVGLVVNPKDGRVRVENVLSVLNAGRVFVPQLVSGQSQGGVAMAIGYSLTEDMPDGMSGPASGEWNLHRYHVPRWGDVPLAGTYAPGGRAQELIILPESPADQGSGRGIAEAVMCSVAPSISNALFDAIGKRLTSLPITPLKILS